jgi:hypothetical protein
MAYMAIQTKFLGPTNYRGDRIKATGMDTFHSDERKRTVTVPYDYGATMEQMHRKAAELLLPQIVSEPERVRLVAGAWERGYIFVPVLAKGEL